MLEEAVQCYGEPRPRRIIEEAEQWYDPMREEASGSSWASLLRRKHFPIPGPDSGHNPLEPPTFVEGCPTGLHTVLGRNTWRIPK